MEKSASLMPPAPMHTASNVSKKMDTSSLTSEEYTFFDNHPLEVTPHLLVANSISNFTAQQLLVEFKVTHLLGKILS